MHYIVFNNPNVVFGWTPKCGCSHVKYLCYFLKTNRIVEKLEWTDISATSLPKNIDEYKIFLILRNPYKRCISGFTERYNRLSDSEKYSWNSKLPLTFYNFIHAMNHKTAIDFNEHFKFHFELQSRGAAPLKNHKNTIVYDIEHIDYEHIGRLFDKTIPPAVINYRGGHHDKNTLVVDKYVGNLLYSEYDTVKPLTRNFFCSKTKKIFDNYYKADFDFCRMHGFNYELDLSENEVMPVGLCGRAGCTYEIHSNPFNNNGKYCCFACMKGHGHGPACEQVQSRSLILEPKPTYLCIGVQKGGTTSLRVYINQHPEIYMSPKEGQFFNTCTLDAQAIKKYESTFNQHNNKPIIGEKTPDYCYKHYAIDRIYSYNPKMKLILILREPISRAYSQYNMRYPHALDNFLPHVMKERNVKLDMINPSMGAGFHIVRGFYSKQIEYILSKFPRENLYIGIAEEIKQNKQIEYNKIFTFLGASKNIVLDESCDTHILKYKEPIKVSDAKILYDIYKGHNEKLYALLGRRIDCWENYYKTQGFIT